MTIDPSSVLLENYRASVGAAVRYCQATVLLSVIVGSVALDQIAAGPDIDFTLSTDQRIDVFGASLPPVVVWLGGPAIVGISFAFVVMTMLVSVRIASHFLRLVPDGDDLLGSASARIVLPLWIGCVDVAVLQVGVLLLILLGPSLSAVVPPLLFIGFVAIGRFHLHRALRRLPLIYLPSED